MAGVLCSGEASGVEATGVYRGVLVEDMIDTVRRVKKPFIDVCIESLFFKDAAYPLTYVPMFNMVLPLKKDQEVWVYFNQENHRYPVLWKLADDVGKDFTDKLSLPDSGSLVSFPNAEDTTSVTKFSDSCWFISTKSYGVLHWGDQCVLMNDDSIITNAKSKLHYKSGGGFVVEAGDMTVKAQDGVSMESPVGKVVIKGSNVDLGTVLYDVVSTLASATSTPAATGSPVTFSPGVIANLTEAATKISLGFKG